MLRILTLVVVSSIIVNSFCYLSREQYEEIKKVATWNVMPYEKFLLLFPNKTFEDISQRAGEKVNSQGSWEKLEDNPKESINFLKSGEDPLPSEFDLRTKYPECFFEPRQQGMCGSCYSFAVTLAFETRVCMKHRARYAWPLSPQFMVSCDSGNWKCRGGLLDRSWTFLENTGTVTERCFPYVSGQEGYVPSCPYNCISSSEQFYKFTAEPGTMNQYRGVDEIKKEIFANGPLTTGMRTFEDFGAYEGGIYEYKWGRETDPHAVMFVGWGRENGVDYWIMKNSWGADWGESGYFRIVMGSVNFPENNACTSQVPVY